MIERVRVALALSLIALTCGCKSVDEYLVDLDTTVPGNPENFDLEEAALLFDPGQLGHEALTGLTKTDEMTFAQAMRSIFHGCNYLSQARDNILLQSDAAVLIGQLGSRIPIEPVTDTLDSFDDNEVMARITPEIETLLQARTVFTIEAEIENLRAPDAVAAADAYRDLRKFTGIDLGRAPEPWREWFAQEEPRLVEEFLQKSRRPFEVIGATRFEAGDSVAMLGVISLWINLYARPELRDVYVPATLNVARQAVVLSLIRAMSRHRDPIVREDVAEAMGKIRDTAFGDALIEQLSRERDAGAASKIIQTLVHYPSRSTVEGIINAMALDQPQVHINAGNTLAALTGEDFGDDERAWVDWWEDVGDKTWP